MTNKNKNIQPEESVDEKLTKLDVHMTRRTMTMEHMVIPRRHIIAKAWGIYPKDK